MQSIRYCVTMGFIQGEMIVSRGYLWNSTTAFDVCFSTWFIQGNCPKLMRTLEGLWALPKWLETTSLTDCYWVIKLVETPVEESGQFLEFQSDTSICIMESTRRWIINSSNHIQNETRNSFLIKKLPNLQVFCWQ